MGRMEPVFSDERLDRFMSHSQLLETLNSELQMSLAAIHAAKAEFYKEVKAYFSVSGIKVTISKEGSIRTDAPALIHEKFAAYSNMQRYRGNVLRRIKSVSKRPCNDALDVIQLLLNAATDLQKCIEWSDLKNAAGYGVIYYLGRQQLVHRVSYVIAKKISLGEIKGMVVRHKCDNPACFNPLHLLIGTQSDNVRDMMERGRDGHGVARGADNPCAKLCDADVMSIRNKLNSGEKTADIATLYEVSKSTIYRIKNGSKWSHV